MAADEPGVPQAPAAPAPAVSQPAPASAPAPAAQPVRYRVHHSYVWLGGLRAALSIVVAIGIALFGVVAQLVTEGSRAANPLLLAAVAGGVALSVLAVVGLIVLVQVFSYKHLYYELGAEEFSLYSGIFNKKRVHVPYHRVQSVDQHASLLQRVFGVCTVVLDTAGGAANKGVAVPYVQKAQAEDLRRELFARKQQALAAQAGAPAPATASVPGGPFAAQQPVAPALAGPHAAPRPGNVLDAPAEVWDDVRGVFGGEHIDTGRASYEYGLTNKELVLTGLSNNSAFAVVAIGVVAGAAQLAGQLAPVLSGVAEPLVGGVVAASSRLFGGNVVALGVAAVLAVSVVLWALSAAGTCLTYGGFRACRRGSRIEVERGLLQHRFQGVDIDRVQSVIVRQSVIRRLLGCCELSLGKIDAADSADVQEQGAAASGLVIHPFVRLSRVPEILAGIVPEFAGVPAEATPVAPAALRRALIRRCILFGGGFWLAVAAGAGQVLANVLLAPADPVQAMALGYVNAGAIAVYVLAVVICALEAAGAVLWARESGFAYNEGFMQVSNGGLARETVSFPRRKIQYGTVRTNPFQRRAGTATVQARIAAGVGGTTVRLVDVREADASAWLAWVRPRRAAGSGAGEPPAPVPAGGGNGGDGPRTAAAPAPSAADVLQ